MDKFLFLLLFSFSCFAKYEDLIWKFSQKYDISPELIEAVISVESNFKNKAKGPDSNKKGFSHGLMQLKFNTAQSLGFKGTLEQLYYPYYNIKYGVKYLSVCRKWSKGNIYLALDYYNRGIGKCKKYPWKEVWIKHKYVGKIIKYIRKNNEGYYEKH